MVLDYSKLEFDSYGRPEVPELMLQTLSGDSLGVLRNVTDLKVHVKFSEPSEITFELHKPADDTEDALYEAVTGYRVIYTKQYGIYVIMNPSTVSDGIEETKQVKGYSYEKLLDTKKIFIEEGTFNFWNPVLRDNTILGRILEIAVDWSVGYVSSSLIGKYRTFDSYDDYLMSYIYNTIPEKFRCVFVFDPYNMTINVYDADEERPSIPVYLDFDNLLEEVKVEEITDDMITALSPYGADDLDVRTINPIGTNWVYDLSYFIYNGDIPTSLAEKWESWQRSVLTNQSYYKGLVSLRASATAQLAALKANLADLNGELETYTIEQSVTIQALALEDTEAGIAYQEKLLKEVYDKIAAKNVEIAAKEKEIATVEASLDSTDSNSYGGQILAVVNQLAFTKYFTSAEQSTLSRYFIEQTITESSFVASEVGSASSGSSYTLTSGTLSVAGALVEEIDFTSDFGKRMFTVEGGSLAVSGTTVISGDIIRATVEVANSGSYIASFYMGSISTSSSTASGGALTFSGTSRSLSSDITTVTTDGISEKLGARLSFSFSSTNMYLTTEVTDYQKYAVQMDLFDFAVAALDDLSSPTYEFSIDSGNLIFAKEFAPFREQLELGKCVYLNLGNNTVITPIMIEYELDFEDTSRFSIIFSNRFKRHDEVNTLKDMIETSYSTSRTFDANQYIYSQSVGQTSAVSKFLSDSLDAAKNNILAASNLSVVISGAGIQVGGESNYQLRIVDNMIAMTDDGWESAKLAIGLFASSEIGEYWGVNADVIGGKLIVGNNLIMESEKADGTVAAFRFDADGASLHNANFDIYDSVGSRHITLSPEVGFAIGSYPLYSSNGSIDTNNANFWVAMNGDIHMKGTLEGCDGTFSGNLSAAGGTFAGNLSAAGGTFSGNLSAVGGTFSGNLNAAGGTFKGNLTAAGGTFSGNLSAAGGTFSGDISAASGTFTGAIKASAYYDLNGNNMMSNGQFTSDYLNLLGLNVGNGNLVIDRLGNVTMKGNMTLGSGSVINWATVTETNVSSSSAYGVASNAQSAANNAISSANTAAKAAAAAQANAVDAADKIAKIAKGEYYSGTYIDGKKIYSPEIYSSKIYSPEIYANTFTVVPSDIGNTSGGLSLYGYNNSSQLAEMFKISYSNPNGKSYVTFFASSTDTYGRFNFDVGFAYKCEIYGGLDAFGNINFGVSSDGYTMATKCNFRCAVDFTGATVTGLSSSATFG